MSNTITVRRTQQWIKNVRAGEPLFTDGLGLPNQVGVLDDPTSLLGSSTAMDSDLITFLTELLYQNVRKVAVKSRTVLVEPAGGVLELPLNEAAGFRFEHSETITPHFNAPVVGEAHRGILYRVQDNSSTEHVFDFANTMVAGQPAQVEYSDNSVPILTYTPDAYDAFYYYLNGTKIVYTPILNKGSDPGSANLFLSSLLLRGTPVATSGDFYAKLSTVVSTTMRAATVPIEVEGEAEIGALNVVGSAGNFFKSALITLIGDEMSHFNSTSSINISSSETAYDVVIAGGVLTLNMLDGRMPSFLHNEDVNEINIFDAPTDEEGRMDIQMEIVHDASTTDYLFNFDGLTIDGVIKPVVWQDRLEMALSQAADAVNTMYLSIYDEFAEARIKNNWS